MFSRSSWLHLRIHFSYFLLPVFLFSLSISPNPEGQRLLWVFLIIHIFLYPASNGYNSYFDKDEESIGGLKNPPPVNRGLYYLSILFDAIATLLGLIFVNATFSIMLVVYGFVSKAYSHPAIRLKKLPFIGWLTIGVFQGCFTFFMCYVGINDFALQNALTGKVVLGGLISTLMLLANYPMTQIYQHAEDMKRRDKTISLLLGLRGTFLFVAGVFLLSFMAFFWYFSVYFGKGYNWTFSLVLFPVVAYFGSWFFQVIKDESRADYVRTMWLNFISSTMLNGFFIYLFLSSTHILDALF